MVRHIFSVAFSLASDGASGAHKAYLELPGVADGQVRFLGITGSTNGGLWTVSIRNGLVSGGGTAPTDSNVDYFKPRCLDQPGVVPRAGIRMFNSASGKTKGGTDGSTIKTLATAPLAPGLDIADDASVSMGGWVVSATEGVELISFSNGQTITGELFWSEDWGKI